MSNTEGEPKRIYRLICMEGPVLAVYDLHVSASDYPTPVSLYNYMEAQPPGIMIYPDTHPNTVTVPTFIPLHCVHRVQDITDRPDLPVGKG